MLRVFGVPLDDDEARRLVATLIVEGTPAALRAAAIVNRGVDGRLYAIALAPDERDAVACALEEAPTDRLGELRGALIRDHRSRTTARGMETRGYRIAATSTPADSIVSVAS